MSRTKRLLPRTERELESASGTLTALSGVDVVAVSATEAQNEFGRIMEQAIGDHTVIITRHSVPKAVLLSVERYRDLASAESTVLDSLTDEFDAMLARMQTPKVRSGTQRGFRATPSAMGTAAQQAARRGNKD